MRQADELPFGFHLTESSHRELSETAGWFDLTAVLADRKTGGSTGPFRFLSVARPFLARSVRASRGFGVSDGVERFRNATARDRRQFFVMFQSLRREVRDHLVRHHALRVVVAVVARVGHELLRTLSDLGRLQIGFHLVEQRRDLLHFVGLLCHVGREDELRFIDQHLSVATLISALVRRGSDPRVGIGEWR